VPAHDDIPQIAPRGRAARRPAPVGAWRIDGAWLEHRGAEVRRMPVEIVLAALDHLAAGGAVGPGGEVLLEHVRGLRAHHPQHGRWAIELRGTRWELAWCPRGRSAQRVGLAGAVEQLAGAGRRRDVA
jgi:hypothetical protein